MNWHKTHFAFINYSLLSMLPLKRSSTPAVMEGSVERISLHNSIHSWAINSSAKDKYSPCFGFDYEVLLVDGTLNSSGLIWTLKVPFHGGAFLLKVEILCRCSSVRIVAI
jgi:hypothetical protein